MSRGPVRSISLFSGVGGLEVPGGPVLACEIDSTCHSVLRRRFQGVEIANDVVHLDPPKADVVTGGWPCQDISVAGLKAGLKGKRSGLFFKMIDIAQTAGAHTVIAENVPNLLKLEDGMHFGLVIEAFRRIGYPHISWRTLNSRAFGMPHQRRRVFMVASQSYSVAASLFRPTPQLANTCVILQPNVSSFYWTAGTFGINLNAGYIPTLKVGTALSIPSAPAVWFDDTIRQITSEEAISLQGFELGDFIGVPDKDIFRLMGNAVSQPVGAWVGKCVEYEHTPAIDGSLIPINNTLQLFRNAEEDLVPEEGWPRAGLVSDGNEFYEFREVPGPLANNLQDYIDPTKRNPLSSRASEGLLRRLSRSGKPCPPELISVLQRLSVNSST